VLIIIKGIVLITREHHLEDTFPCISIGNSTVSRGIWDKYCEWYFKIYQNITSHRGSEWYLGSAEISLASIYPKYPEETVLFPVYTKRQRHFALYVTAGIIFTCKYFKFGLNTTGLSQSHFRNLSACSIITVKGICSYLTFTKDDWRHQKVCLFYFIVCIVLQKETIWSMLI